MEARLGIEAGQSPGTYFFRAARNLSNSFRLIEIEKTCSELVWAAI